MKEKSQIHIGYGDNVGGDKIIIVRLVQAVLLIALIFTTVYVIQQNKEPIQKSLGIGKIFAANDSQFNILILPLISVDGPKNDGAYYIKTGLEKLNLEHGLNIKVQILEDYTTSQNLDRIEVEALRKFHRADMVVFGDYYIPDQNIRLGFLIDQKRNKIFQSLVNSTSHKADFYDFRKGRVSGNVDFIVYWIAGISNINNYNFKAAQEQFSYILDSLNIHRTPIQTGEIYETIILSLYRYGNYEKAKDVIKNYLDAWADLDMTSEHKASFLQLSAQNYLAQGLLQKGLEEIKQAFALAQKHQFADLELKIRIMLTLQTAYGYINENEKAVTIGLEILSLCDSVDYSDPLVEATVNSNLAAEYNKLGRLEEGYQCIQKSITIQSTVLPIDSVLYAYSLSTLGENYALKAFNRYDQKAFENLNTSIEYSQQAFAVAQRHLSPSNLFLGIVQYNLGTSFMQIAGIDTLKINYNYDLAEQAFKKSESVMIQLDEAPHQLPTLYSQLAALYMYKKDFAKAELYLDQMAELNKKLYPTDPEKLFIQYVTITSFHLKNDNKNKAFEIAKKTAEQFTKISNTNSSYAYYKQVVDTLDTKFDKPIIP